MEPTVPAAAPAAAPAAPAAAPLATSDAAAAAPAATDAAAAAAPAAADAAAPKEAVLAAVEQPAAPECLLTVDDSTSPMAIGFAGLALLALVVKLFRGKKKAQ